MSHTAFVELFADDSKLVRGLRRAERRVKAFGKRIGDIGRKLVRLGAALSVPIALSTRVFAGFDDQMRAVQAVIGAAGTFNAASLLGLQAGGMEDRIANGIDKIERNTRPLRDAKGVAFA